MAKTRKEKEKILLDLEKNIKGSEMLVYLKIFTLSVNKQNEIRRRLEKHNSKMIIAKKTLLSLALRKCGIKKIDISDLEGTIPFIFIKEKDFIPSLKIIYDYQKEFEENLKMIGGYDKKNFYSASELISLAKLPPREVLIGKAIGIISSPLFGLVSALNNILIKPILVLENINSSRSA